MSSNTNSNGSPNSKGKYPWKVGDTYVISIPPGWIVGGTIREVYDDCIVLKAAVYFETVKAGASAMGHYAMARNQKELDAASDRSWPLPDGYVVRIDCITHASPASFNFARLAKQGQIDTIKNA